MPKFNDPTIELTYLEKDDVIMSGSPDDFSNIKAQNLFHRDITRSALMTLIQTNKLLKGQHYVISNAVSNTMSLMVIAVDVDALNEIAVDTTNGNNVSYDIDTDVATAIQQTQINGTGFVKASGTTISYDNSTYLTSISGISAGGELSGNYPNPNLVNSAVTGKVLTGLSVTGSAIVSTDSMLTAFGKLQNQVNALVGGVNYRGTWNASTNNPSLASGVGTQGYYYVVSVAGSTNLDGITTWELGDWAIFNGTAWQKVDNTDAVVSVNGYTGIVTLSATDVGAVPTSSISGTSGYLPLFGASNTLGNSIVRESAGKIGIGGSPTTDVLEIFGNGNLGIKVSTTTNTGSDYVAYRYYQAGLEIASTYTNLGNYIVSVNGTGRMLINSTGQIITASATNTGEHFIVGGTSRFNGAMSVISGNINLSNAYFLSARNNADSAYISLIGRNSSDRVIIDADGYGTTIGGGGSVILNPTSGNVGIGTTSPNAKFVISNAGAEGIEMGYTAGLVGNYMQSIDRTTTQGVDFIYYLTNSAKHRFYTGASERFVIEGNGQIITASATNTGEHFIVGGTSRFNGNSIITGQLRVNGASGNANTIFDLKVSTDNNIGIRTGTSLGSFGTAIQFHNDAVSAYTIGAIEASTLLLNSVSGGNVGIGTTSPTYFGGYSTLAINGATGGIFETQSAGTSAMLMFSNDVASLIREQRNLPLIFGTNNTERMRITSGGNVLIGTTTDNGVDKLQVNGSGYFGGNVQIFGANQALVMASSTTTLYTTYRANSVDVGYIGNGTGTIGSGATDFGIRAENNLIFAILNVEKMRIKSNTINISSLPTSASGLSAGDLWNNSGVVSIV